MRSTNLLLILRTQKHLWTGVDEIFFGRVGCVWYGMVWYGIVEFNVPLGRMCDWHQLITDFGGIFRRNLLITHKNFNDCYK